MIGAFVIVGALAAFGWLTAARLKSEVAYWKRKDKYAQQENKRLK